MRPFIISVSMVGICMTAGTVLSVLVLKRNATAQEITCGGAPCEEAVVCGLPSTVACADWNNASTDGWAISPWGGGSIKPGVGHGGTAGWEALIRQGEHGTIYFDRAIRDVAHGPLHARFYVKFSPGYIFIPTCGLQKMFYLDSHGGGTYWRIMLGVAPANWMGGSFAGLSQTVGVFGFDYVGHIMRLPDQPGDNPVLIHPNRWYSVEIMAHWTSRTQNVVKIWIDGRLQMTRDNFDDGHWTAAHVFSTAQDSSHYGGDGPACAPVQTQYVYKDNHIISTKYIGPIGCATADCSPGPV